MTIGNDGQLKGSSHKWRNAKLFLFLLKLNLNYYIPIILRYFISLQQWVGIQNRSSNLGWAGLEDWYYSISMISNKLQKMWLSLWILRRGKLAYLGCALRVSLLCPFIFAAFSLAPPPGVGGPSLSSLFTAFPGFRPPLGFLRFFFAWMANTAIQKEYHYDGYRVSQQKEELYCNILHGNFN